MILYRIFFICLTIFLSISEFCFGELITNKKHRLDLGLNVRFRYEYQNNFNIKSYGKDPVVGEQDDGFLIGRIRTGIDYYFSSKLHVSLWIQDSRVWDLDVPDKTFYKYNFNREHNPYKDPLELWNSYVELIEPFSLPVTIKAGRQRIHFGDNRIFGPGEWGNTGSWIWDAIKSDFKFKSGYLSVFYGRSEIHDPDDFSLNHRHGYECVGLYSHFDVFKKLFFIEPFTMTKKDNHNRYKSEKGIYGDLDTYYYGVRAYTGYIKGFKINLLYVTQQGDYSKDDVDAYGYHAWIGYKLNSFILKPQFSIEYSFASGDSNPKDGKHETFDGAYGSKDKAYGRMNLFKWQNIKDQEVNLELYPSEKSYIKLEFHRFYLAEKKDAWYHNAKIYRDKRGNSGDFVGKEFDVVAKFKPLKKTEIQIGYGHFWPDEFAKNVASNSQADWIFFMITKKFSTKIY